MVLPPLPPPARASALFLAGLMACAHVGGKPKEGGLVAGTVAYRERIALPDSAVVLVELSDVSRQDAARVVADTSFVTGGRQVPLPFELQYDPRTIEPDHRYALRATIQSAGQPLFATDTAYHVITRGAPNKVELVLVRAGGE